MDGVLLRSMHLHCRAWERAAASLGLSVDRRAILRREGEPGASTVRFLAPPRLQRRLLQRKETYFAEGHRRIRLYAGARSLIERLARTSVRLGLVTGTSRAELQAALPNRLFHRFHASVTGDEVARGKPHPAPYRAICRRLHVRPEGVLVVENAPFGIQSARRARMGCVMAIASTLPAPVLRGADRVFISMHTLSRWCGRNRMFTHRLTMQELHTRCRR